MCQSAAISTQLNSLTIRAPHRISVTLRQVHGVVNASDWPLFYDFCPDEKLNWVRVIFLHDWNHCRSSYDKSLALAHAFSSVIFEKFPSTNVLGCSRCSLIYFFSLVLEVMCGLDDWCVQNAAENERTNVPERQRVGVVRSTLHTKRRTAY